MIECIGDGSIEIAGDTAHDELGGEESVEEIGPEHTNVGAALDDALAVGGGLVGVDQLPEVCLDCVYPGCAVHPAAVKDH